jgi:hypothetical protein
LFPQYNGKLTFLTSIGFRSGQQKKSVSDLMYCESDRHQRFFEHYATLNPKYLALSDDLGKSFTFSLTRKLHEITGKIWHLPTRLHNFLSDHAINDQSLADRIYLGESLAIILILQAKGISRYLGETDKQGLQILYSQPLLNIFKECIIATG